MHKIVFNRYHAQWPVNCHLNWVSNATSTKAKMQLQLIFSSLYIIMITSFFSAKSKAKLNIIIIYMHILLHLLWIPNIGIIIIHHGCKPIYEGFLYRILKSPANIELLTYIIKKWYLELLFALQNNWIPYRLRCDIMVVYIAKINLLNI